jgi:hypothetical protein
MEILLSSAAGFPAKDSWQNSARAIVSALFTIVRFQVVKRDFDHFGKLRF